MRINKVVTVVVATLCGLLLAAPASARGPYPPVPPNLIVTPAVIQVGETATVRGFNFGANDVVRITVFYSNLGGFDNGVAGAEGLERGRGGGGHGGGGHGGGCRDGGNGFDGGTTVVADANGNFTTTLQLNQAGVAGIGAAGWPSGVQTTARVLVLCDDDGGYGNDQASSDRPLASGNSTSARSSAVSWVRTAAGIFGGLVPAAMGFVLR